MSRLTLTVLLGTSLLGAVAGVVGAFAVLRRRALVGDVLAHAALPGVCLAFLIMGQRQFAGLVAGGLVAALAALAAMAVITRWSRTKEDAAIGIVLSTFFGAGTVLMSIVQQRPGGGSQSGLGSYIYGQAATMTATDVQWIAAVAAALLALVVVFYKEFQLFSFDPEFAHAQGWPGGLLDGLMMGSLAVVTVVGLPAVGVVLMAAMLIIPAATARFWTDRLSGMLVLSGLLGMAAAGAGTAVSAGMLSSVASSEDLGRGLPTGPSIVLTGALLFGFSVIAAPGKGVVARLLEHWRLRRRTAWQHLLRTLYELNEARLPERAVWTSRQVVAHRPGLQRGLRVLLWRLQRAGWMEQVTGGFRLSDRGLREAARITRAHRLWELYLIQGVNIAPDHVDRDADDIEHWLGGGVVARLQAELTARGEWPADEEAVPASPHEIATTAPAPLERT